MAQLYNYMFDGQKGQRDAGWRAGFWYDKNNVQVPIDHVHGTPTHWIYWEARGQSYDADDARWNRFKAPEQRFMWDRFLPAHEHDNLLNSIGQSYNWFHGNSPFHSRIARPTFLRQGQVELSFEFYADWYQWKGRKIPKNEVSDSNGCRAELFIVDTGLSDPYDWDTEDKDRLRDQQHFLEAKLAELPGRHDDWLVVNPALGPTIKTKTIDVPHDGVYLLVYGIYTVWAVPDGKGRNGLFVLAAGASQDGAAPSTPVVEETPRPEEIPAVDPALPTGSGTDGAQRGAPRVPYQRTYQLLHNSISDARAAEIFLDGFRQGKTTGTSADDAGLGDLENKIVEVYGWPAAEQSELITWFNTHYPGTQVSFK